MLDKDKIEIQEKLIKDLKTENTELKDKITKLETRLDYEHELYEQKKRDLNCEEESCKNLIFQYKELIEDLKKMKEEYNGIVHDIKDIKNKYNKCTNKAIKQFTKIVK